MSPTAARLAGATASAAAIEEIEVIASDRVDEIDEALALVHDGFVEAGYLAPQGSGRRMHRSYLNPGTVFFIALMDGEPVGTCAFIADGPFGLPSDRAFIEENDEMRAECGRVLRECGSLSVRRDARRHTRRIVMRLIAAMSRLAYAEFPTAPIPLAVAPENRRFYEAMVGARPVAGPRPLYGAPAILLRTCGVDLDAHYAKRATPSQRMMHALFTEPAPSWLRDRRSHLPLPPEWLQALLDEQGVVDSLSDQVRLLAAMYPAALGRIIGTYAAKVAA